MLLCLPLLGLWLGPACKLPLIFLGLPVPVSVIGPCNHAFIFAFSLGRPVRASSLLLSLLCSHAFLCLPCCFYLFLSFALLLFSFLLLPFWLGGFCGSAWLVFWVLCCPLLCWGFGSPCVFCPVLCVIPGLGLQLAPCVCPVPCVISLGWGFGSPRVFCLVLLCDFSVLGLRLGLCVLSCSVVCFFCVGASARPVRLRLAASTWCWASACPCYASFCLLAGVFAWGCSRPWISCPFFFWWVCGITGSWKGSQVTRVAAVQCSGVGRDRYLWGRRLATILSS